MLSIAAEKSVSAAPLFPLLIFSLTMMQVQKSL